MSTKKTAGKKTTTDEVPQLSGFYIDTVEKIAQNRVRAQIRLTHLGKQNRSCPSTQELLEKLKVLEEESNEKLAAFVQAHPAYKWFSQIKGIGPVNIGKVICCIDIKRATTISALWSFAGYAVVDGKAPKPVKGQKLLYNKLLRTLCYRMGESLIRAKGTFYEEYLKQKRIYQERYAREGKKIVPATKLPIVGGKKVETAKFISEGHVHNQAMRKMIKLFLACLWMEWRKACNLLVRKPYAIEKFEHTTFIDPKSMIDKKAAA